MKTTILKISSCFILSILVVAGLFAWSRQKTRKDNGFYRLLPPHPAIKVKAMDLNYNSYYVAGTDKDVVYLSNYTAPLHLVKVNLPDLDTTHIQLRVDAPEMKFRKNTEVAIRPPHFYLMDGVTPMLKRGKLNEWTARNFMYNEAFFSTAVPFGSASLFIDALSNKTKERSLGIETDTEPHVRLVPEVLEKQLDGIFCTNGKMLYNKDLHQMVYVYYYRNQYIVTDTTLTVQYRANTIDTISRVRIKTGTINEGRTKKLASPPYVVNNNGATSGNFLYVQSNLMAKNEKPENFEHKTVIDVYDLVKQSYAFSFYLPPYREQRVSRFYMTGEYLVAIYGQHLVLYRLYNEFT